MRPIVLAVLGVVASTSLAFAHAHLVSALPAAGGTVQAAPPELAITYTEALEPKFSSISVTSPTGARVDKGDLRVVGGTAKTVAVELGTLPPGTYHVEWHATSVDTHKTEGTFTFTVSP